MTHSRPASGSASIAVPRTARAMALLAALLGTFIPVAVHAEAPDTRTLPELLCSEADHVIRMTKSVLRNEFGDGAAGDHDDDRLIEWGRSLRGRNAGRFARRC